jgi:hypothetical protein
MSVTQTPVRVAALAGVSFSARWVARFEVFCYLSLMNNKNTSSLVVGSTFTIASDYTSPIGCFFSSGSPLHDRLDRRGELSGASRHLRFADLGHAMSVA